jgi:hypothetical protein
MRHRFLHLSLLVSPVFGGVSCDDLPREFSDLFLSALDEIETRVSDEVDSVFDEIGFGPLGTSLLVHDIYNFKAGLFQNLFGTKEERNLWINGTTGTVIDIYEELNANIANVTGNASLNVSCFLSDTDGDALDDKYVMDLTVRGSLPSLDSLVPKVTILPSQSFPSFVLNVSAIDVEYELKLPLTLYRGINKLFLLGDTQAALALNFDAAISESLPILLSENITFAGAFDFGALLSYSAINGCSSSGSFSTSLVADIDGSYVGFRAQDDNIFDSNPRK